MMQHVAKSALRADTGQMKSAGDRVFVKNKVPIDDLVKYGLDDPLLCFLVVVQIHLLYLI